MLEGNRCAATAVLVQHLDMVLSMLYFPAVCTAVLNAAWYLCSGKFAACPKSFECANGGLESGTWTQDSTAPVLRMSNTSHVFEIGS